MRVLERREATIGPGLPSLVTGDGPPMLLLQGLSPEHTAPTGMDLMVMGSLVKALAEHVTVYFANRRPGLAEGTTMHDLAGDVAEAVEQLGAPMPVMGVSTGGSIALQLAVDRPELVDRLVIASSACRLGEGGRAVQRRVAEHTRVGEHRAAWAALGGAIGGPPLLRRTAQALMWTMGPVIAPEDPSDMLVTIAAEDEFGVCDQLDRVTARTMVVGSGRDGFYSPELFRRTAQGIRGARLGLHPNRGHAGELRDPKVRTAILEFLLD